MWRNCLRRLACLDQSSGRSYPDFRIAVQAQVSYATGLGRLVEQTTSRGEHDNRQHSLIHSCHRIEWSEVLEIDGRVDSQYSPSAKVLPRFSDWSLTGPHSRTVIQEVSTEQ